MNKVSHNHFSCRLDFSAFFGYFFFFYSYWLELALLDLVLQIIELGDGGAESVEDEGDEEGRAGEHEVSFGHVELTIVTIELQVILLMFCSH